MNPIRQANWYMLHLHTASLSCFKKKIMISLNSNTFYSIGRGKFRQKHNYNMAKMMLLYCSAIITSF